LIPPILYLFGDPLGPEDPPLMLQWWNGISMDFPLHGLWLYDYCDNPNILGSTNSKEHYKSLSIYLSIHLSIHPSIYLLIYILTNRDSTGGHCWPLPSWHRMRHGMLHRPHWPHGPHRHGMRNAPWLTWQGRANGGHEIIGP
jgi:hypothetical protein